VLEQADNSRVVLLLWCKLAVALHMMRDFVELAMGAIENLVEMSLGMTK
jgi:hypothetical protein